MMPSDGVCLSALHVIVRLWGDPAQHMPRLQKSLEELRICAELGVWGQCSFVGDGSGHMVTGGGRSERQPLLSLAK